MRQKPREMKGGKDRQRWTEWYIEREGEREREIERERERGRERERER